MYLKRRMKMRGEKKVKEDVARIIRHALYNDVGGKVGGRKLINVKALDHRTVGFVILAPNGSERWFNIRVSSGK